MPNRAPVLVAVLSALLMSLAQSQLTLSPPPKRYFCDTTGRDYITEPTDFELYTRPTGSDQYRPGDRCAFHAISKIPGALYFVQLINVSMPTANLSIRSNEHTLLLLSIGASLRGYAMALVTPQPSVTVSFVAASGGADSAANTGALIRVRLFVGCPPEWRSIGNYCFGNAGSVGPPLNFADSQAACASMRSNLLHLPPDLPGISTITELFRQLPGQLTTNNWIGLTDYTSAGQFYYYWLDGSQFYEPNLIGCQSSKLGNNRNCELEERCGFFITHLLYLFRFIVMDRCSSERSYACFMPAGGANAFYRVPEFSIFSSGAWAWAIVIGCLFAIGVAIGVVYAVLRLCNARRSNSTMV